MLNIKQILLNKIYCRFIFIVLFLFFISLCNVQYASADLGVSPNNINVTVGYSKTFTISGGTGFYNITSSSDATATASISGAAGTDGTITGVAPGTAVITIEDNSGASVTINVNVTQLTLSQTSVTLLPQTSEIITVLTGSTFYNVETSNAQVAEAGVSNDQITITGITPGTAIISVSDSNLNTAVIAVTVGSSFTITPSSITVFTGQTATATISDSTAFYNISSNDPSIATVAISGTTISVTGVSNGNTTIIVQNSDGFTFNLDVTVDTSSTTTINLELSESQTVSLGDGSGFYQVDVPDTAVATIIISGNSATITGVGPGKTLITIRDNETNEIKFEVNVKLPAPVLNVSVNGSIVQLLWNKDVQADSYILFAAPANANGDIDTTNIIQINVGTLDPLTFNLRSGDHYFAAIQAVSVTDPDISSSVSNIEEITIP